MLPQFDVGDSFVSDFYVINSGSQTASFSITFYDDNGNPVSVPFSGLGTLSVLSGSVPAGGANFYEAGTPQGNVLDRIGRDLFPIPPSRYRHSFDARVRMAAITRQRFRHPPEA